MAALKPAYFFYGNDDVKVAAARQRLAQRAQTGGAQLEHFRHDSCTPQAVAGAISMPSLLGGSRIILADGIDKWKAADIGPVADAIGFLAPGEADAHDSQQAIAVFISKSKPLMAIEKAIKAIGGEVKEFKAPSEKAMPKRLQEQARAMGCELELAAAELMVALVGVKRPLYLRSELEKLATYRNGETITREDVELLGTGETEPRVFALGDAVIEGDDVRAINLARELIASGERPQGMLFALVRTFSQAQRAAAVLSEGGDVASELGISEWLANKQVIPSARLRGPDALAQAMVTLAQLDRDSKGGNALDDETNLMVALNELTA